ncbi:TonB-dependent receptor [Sphingobium sufflavum]|uniref:TonB-dependent receptor plug domain-containing protein n=1 Tax=Sphingobium sufflavum TaxID=1129547 RepID=UPI001F38DC86|nr:TonB-dependent receptor [Sphingobium sufflavum]MCE7796130.1 TonB-dependent receptor [Sphingobium sufflavum]
MTTQISSVSGDARARRAPSLLAGTGWLALAALAAFAPLSAHAADAAAAASDTAAADAASDAGPGDIIVTGSRVSRTVAESVVPIDVIGEKQLQATGKVNVRDILQQLVPSYNNASGWTGGTGEAVKSASLRGLNSDQTLVLVNGKRRAGHSIVFVTARGNLGASPVDLDYIPSSSVSRIEVLRDGAAAQYGSDAIAGVINIILKDKGEGGSFSATAGQYTKHDGVSDKLGETIQINFDQGFNLGEQGFLRVFGNYNHQNYTNRLGATAACTTADRARTCLYPAGDPREQTASRYRGKQGLPQTQTINVGYNAEVALGSDITAYSFATFSDQNSYNFGIYRPPASLQNLPSVYPEGYLPQFTVNTQAWQGVFGLKGSDLLGWDWDFSTSYANNKARLENNASLNPSLGPTSPRDIFLGNTLFTEWTTNLDLKRQIETGLFAEPLNFAIGAEYRRNHFEQQAGEPASYQIGTYVFPTDPTDPNYSAANAGKRPSGGASGLGGFDPAALGNRSRSNVSLYLDLAQKLTQGWEVGFAGRYEHYSDFGSTWSGKFSTRVEVLPGVALRGSVSNGFRAPSLQQQTYTSLLPNYVTQGTAQVLSIVRYIPADSTVARAIGASALRPEKSLDLTAGIVLQPLRNLSVSLDAYQIDINDRILATGQLLSLTAGSPLQQALVAAGANPGDTFSYFTNAADTRTRGLDLVVEYQQDLGNAGKINWSLASAFNETTIRKLAPTPAVLSGSGLSLFDRGRIGDLTKAYPKNRTILSANWQVGKFSATVREAYYSATWSTDTTTPGRDSRNSPAFITDLDVNYQATSNIRLTVGANNLFNKMPSQINPDAQLYYGWWAQNPVYNLTSPYGYNGGFYYARIGLSW